MSKIASLSSILRYNINSQLVGQLPTFLITVYLLRQVDGNILGLINVRLNLLYTTIGFLCREPLRKLCLNADLRLRETGKYAWLSPLLGICFSILLGSIWAQLPIQNLLVVHDYRVLVFYFCLAAFLETLTEPLAILSLKSGDNAMFAIAQSALLMSNKFSTLLMILCGVEPKSALCFGQVIGSVTYTLIFYVKFIKLYVSGRLYYSPWPSLKMRYDKEHLKSIGNLLLHSVFEQFISDGSAYIMTFSQILSFAEQATHNTIERVGSLIVQCFLGSNSFNFERNKRRVIPQKLLNLFMMICRTLMVFCVLSIPYSLLAISIYEQKLLSFYLLFVTVNGITECFAVSTMEFSRIRKHAKFLFITSVLHLIANTVLLNLFGTSGFILTNIIHMILRIHYNWKNIKRLSNTLKFSTIILDITLILLLLLTLITGLSNSALSTLSCWICVGAQMIIDGVLLIMFYLHQNRELYQKWWKKFHLKVVN